MKTKNSQEVLQKLEEFLKSNCEEPALILCGFWKDQQNAITYQELRQAVMDGAISQETLRLWSQDYSLLIANKLNSMWTDAIVAGSKGPTIFNNLDFEFRMQSQGIHNWIKNRGAEFVTSVVQEQKDAIAALLTKKMRDGHTVDELARMIRPCIGLTEGQAKANAKYYDSIVANLKKEHPRMKPESIRQKARDAAAKYAERQHRQRAMTIAQTESAFAYNRGADEAVRQAQEEGLLGTMKKQWCTSGDDAVCNICASLEGIEIDMDSDFNIGGRVLFRGQHMLPPAHPRCGCAVEYIEVEKPFGSSYLGAGSSDDVPEVGVQELGEIDVENTDAAIAYYNEQIRYDEKENLIAIDRNGRVYYSEGSKDSVGFSGIDLSGATVTHNHPSSNGIVSFGKDDFVFLQENQDIRKLVAVNELYTYTVNVLNDISGLSYSDYYRKAMEDMVEMDLDFDIQHKVFEILNMEGFVDYVREEFN